MACCYGHLELKVGESEAVNYVIPLNAKDYLLGPSYLYFSFVPNTFDHYGTTQGLQVRMTTVNLAHHAMNMYDKTALIQVIG
jgi:hypothetical protein